MTNHWISLVAITVFSFILFIIGFIILTREIIMTAKKKESITNMASPGTKYINMMVENINTESSNIAEVIYNTGDVRACRESLCDFEKTMSCGPMTVNEFDRAIAEAYRAGAKAALVAAQAEVDQVDVTSVTGRGVHAIGMGFINSAREKMGIKE